MFGYAFSARKHGLKKHQKACISGLKNDPARENNWQRKLSIYI